MIWKKSNPVHDLAARRSWKAEQWRCACCWRTLGVHFGGWWLDGHHIIKAGRSDERCNLLPLCNGFIDTWRCHDLAEGHRIRQSNGLLYPELTLANCLWLKRDSDPDNWNPERLAELYHKALPEPEQPAEIFFQARLDHS